MGLLVRVLRRLNECHTFNGTGCQPMSQKRDMAPKFHAIICGPPALGVEEKGFGHPSQPNGTLIITTQC